MRTPHRDRRRYRIACLCIGTLALIVPALALNATFAVLGNATAYTGAVEIVNKESYAFVESGLLGERIPLKVEGVNLTGACDPCNTTWSPPSTITFLKGNYTVSYMAQIRENHIQLAFEEPYNVTIGLPSGLDVRNPFMGMISPGGIATDRENETVEVTWESTRNAEIRFYDAGRLDLLYLFGNFWIILAVILLMPFVLTMRRRM